MFFSVVLLHSIKGKWLSGLKRLLAKQFWFFNQQRFESFFSRGIWPNGRATAFGAGD